MSEIRSTPRLSAAESARKLRKDLRVCFPGTRFSVRLSRGTAYGNCRVEWTGGPSVEKVRRITGSYETRGFDCMTDSTTFKESRIIDEDGSMFESGLGMIIDVRHKEGAE